MARVNHFSTLGLPIGASEEDVKKTFRKLAKQWHPDKNKAKGAKERFQQISTAHDYLSNKDRRELHERDLKCTQRRPSQHPFRNSHYNPNSYEHSHYYSRFNFASNGNGFSFSQGTDGANNNNSSSSEYFVIYFTLFLY